MKEVENVTCEEEEQHLLTESGPIHNLSEVFSLQQEERERAYWTDTIAWDSHHWRDEEKVKGSRERGGEVEILGQWAWGG